MNLKKTIKVIAPGLILLASLPSLAQGFASLFGEYHLLPSGEVRIHDTQLRLSPTVKVFKQDGKPGTLENIKNGQMVKVGLLRIGKRILVDTIHLDNTRAGNSERVGE